MAKDSISGCSVPPICNKEWIFKPLWYWEKRVREGRTEKSRGKMDSLLPL